MSRDDIIIFMKENPNTKVTHWLFSSDEFIYQKEDGRVYDENGYLFEDWCSNGAGQHNGIRMRIGGNWDDGWKVKEDSDMCRKSPKIISGKEYTCSDCSKS